MKDDHRIAVSKDITFALAKRKPKWIYTALISTNSTTCSTPSWPVRHLVSSPGRAALHWYRRVRTPYEPDCFLFATAKKAAVNAMIFFHLITKPLVYYNFDREYFSGVAYH